MHTYTLTTGSQCAIAQEQGKATATVSDMEWIGTSLTLKNPQTMLSYFDAVTIAILRGDEEFKAARDSEWWGGC